MANTNSNAYTVTYAVIMTLLVAVSLAAVATGLKPLQEKEEALDKKKQILNSVSAIADKSLVEAEYAKRITEKVVDANGKEVAGAVAFDIDLRKEYRKPAAERQLPLYLYKNDDGSQSYIMPLHGAGLWDEIWGFVALQKDANTIVGASYGHAGETPGLGAEMTQPWFQDQFKGKQLANSKGEFELKVLKGKGNPIDGKPYAVDGMSGATITGDGVQAMIDKGYKSYEPFFKRN